jgi:hypothetical protein
MAINIRTVDPSTLVDIQDVKIDVFLPKAERMKQYIDQHNGNPYFCKCDDTVIKISNIKTHYTLTDRFRSFISDIRAR